MDSADSLERALRHDRIITGIALAGIGALAWGYMIYEARAMEDTGVCACAGMIMSGPDMQPWSVTAILPLFLMWAEMMVAMMIPSAAPVMLMFARVNRERRKQERPFVPTGLFLCGYLIAWTLFSLGAAVLQWALHGATLLSAMMVSSSSLLSGIILIATGIFQWTPVKRACLSHCRSPLTFLLTDWHEGQFGAVKMGFKHGIYCTGCCWLLMLILFVAGVMNMWWVAAITALVIVEKLLTRGPWIASVVGILCVAWGVWLMVQR